MNNEKKIELKDLWRKDKLLKTLDNLHSISILSLDIFDTLLFRSVANPADIFSRVWEEVMEKGLSDYDISPDEFQQLRCEAEKKAIRKIYLEKKTKEVNLNDIYNAIPNIVGDKEKIMMLEVEIEKRNCYPNPSIVSLMKFAKKNNKTVVLLSDMYLPKKYIEEILKLNGIDSNFYDKLFVSNEENMSKREGSLFNKLIEINENVDYSNIVHIGDNYHSDYESAINHGIRAIHYNVVPANVNSVYFYEKIRHGILLEEILSLRKLASSLNNYYNKTEKVAYEVGANILGPFLSLFVTWVVKKMQDLNINRIYPLMREGELLKKLLDNELVDKDLNYEVKQIYVSRKSTYLPSLKELTKENLEKVIIAKNLSIKDLFKLFGLSDELETFKYYQDYLFKDAHKINYCDKYNLHDKIMSFLLQDKVKKKIDNNIRLKRINFINYFKQETNYDFNNIATIDIGYNGTIQSAIEDALKIEGLDNHINHFIAMGSERIKDKLFNNIKIRGFISNYNENIDLIRTILLSADVLEQLILSTEGSTAEYEIINGTVKPIKLENFTSNDLFKNACWNGIFEFQRLWFYFRKLKPELANGVTEKRREIMMILHRLIDMPMKQEAFEIGNLQYDDNFGSSNVDVICSNQHEDILNDKGLEYIEAKRIYGYRHTDIPWIQGLITLKDEFYYLRKYSEMNNYDEYFKIAKDLVFKIKSKGIKEIVVYGAGEVGSRIIKACNLYGIKILNIVDRKESLWGKEIEGIEIISLDKAVKKGHVNYVVGSLAFIDEIKKGIISKFIGSDTVPNIFSA